MRIVVAGGHGQIAMLLHPLLKARGHQGRGLIRNPDHADEVRQAGAEPVLCDLEAEDDIAEAVWPTDAVVFAAGAGTAGLSRLSLPGLGDRRYDLSGHTKELSAPNTSMTTWTSSRSASIAENPVLAVSSSTVSCNRQRKSSLRPTETSWAERTPMSRTTTCGVSCRDGPCSTKRAGAQGVCASVHMWCGAQKPAYGRAPTRSNQGVTKGARPHCSHRGLQKRPPNDHKI